MRRWAGLGAPKTGFSNVREVMPIAPPACAAPRARPDVGLLDAPSVYIDFRQRSAIAILSERTQRDFAGSDEHLQSPFRRPSARLVQLGGVDVRETHFLVIAHQRIAVDRDAALAGNCSTNKSEQQPQERDAHEARNAQRASAWTAT